MQQAIPHGIRNMRRRCAWLDSFLHTVPQCPWFSSGIIGLRQAIDNRQILPVWDLFSLCSGTVEGRGFDKRYLRR
jgi:hypothetical protein